MGHWTAYVAAAFALALLIRLDAKMFGPYFSLSNVITGFEGLDALYWHERKDLQRANRRRLAWPLLVGFAISWSDLASWETGLVTLLGAILLLWPMVFQGLPFGVARRSWQLPTLYGTFLLVYFGLGVLGERVQGAVTANPDNFRDWALSNGAGCLIVAAVVLVLSAVYARVWTTVRDTWERNTQGAYAYDPEGNA